MLTFRQRQQKQTWNDKLFPIFRVCFKWISQQKVHFWKRVLCGFPACASDKHFFRVFLLKDGFALARLKLQTAIFTLYVD